MKREIKLRISEDDADVAYLQLPAHPDRGRRGVVKKTIRLSEHLPDYKGADLYLDIDEHGEVIGIEILV